MTTHDAPDQRLLYTRAEAAALLGVTESWLRDKVSSREIPHVRLGTRKGVRFRLADLEAIIEARLRPASPKSAVEDLPKQSDTPSPLRSLRAPGAKKPGGKNQKPKAA